MLEKGATDYNGAILAILNHNTVMNSVTSDHIEIVKIMLDKGADINKMINDVMANMGKDNRVDTMSLIKFLRQLKSHGTDSDT